MNKILLSIISVFIFISLANSQSISKIEPPFWWVGMQNPELQLMLYGDEIGNLEVKIDSKFAQIKDVHRPTNSNYLFVDLMVSTDAKPGPIKFELYKSNKRVIEFQYNLKERRSDSANRKGNSSADAIYLITPDRFANGDPSNDEVEGLKEGLGRDLEYGRHGGDIKGIANHLSYIKELGFTSIWLNPVLENDQPQWSYHGYATTDYYNTDKRFGTNQEYKDLCKQAHDMGIGVIMDIIVNHCGSEHWWMSDPPFDDWINFQNESYQNTNHRKMTLVDPYASKRDRRIMTEGWFVKAMPDLNQRNPFMSTYLIQNSIWWIENTHITGIRQDTYSYPFRTFMTDWTCAIMNEYPDFYIVGEEWIDNPAVISYWQMDKVNHDGYTSCLPGLMDFPMCFALHKALNEEEKWGEGWVKLYEKLGNDFLYAHPQDLVVFPDNHDMSRIYTQLNEDYDLYRMAMTYILTTRGIPQIYYGTEILMSNKGSDSHGIIRSDFPGGWDGDSKSVVEKRGMSEMELEALEFNTKLLNWRKSNPVIHNGKMMHFEPKEKVYVYFRYDDSKIVMIILNKNDAPYELDLTPYAEMLENRTIGKNILTAEKINLKEKLVLKEKGPLILEIRK